MVWSRHYPDDPSGPFPTPPATVEDGAGRTIDIVTGDSLDGSEDADRDALADTAAVVDDHEMGDDEKRTDSHPNTRTAGTSERDRETERPTSESVLDELTAMYVAFDPADRAQGIPPNGEERIRDWLEPIVRTGINVVACHDGSVVGHATLVPEEMTEGENARVDPAEHEWELAIFVLQAYQEARIGTHLLEHLLGYAATNGVERVWLTVERWNGPAISLYKQVGFEICTAESFELEMSIQLE